MASTVETRLNDMGIIIPDAPAPAANYVPWMRSGNMVHVAGQVPFVDGKLTATGHLGDNASVEDGYEQAKICAINLIAQVKAACDGDLDRVVQVVKLGGFVACVSSVASMAWGLIAARRGAYFVRATLQSFHPGRHGRSLRQRDQSRGSVWLAVRWTSIREDVSSFCVGFSPRLRRGNASTTRPREESRRVPDYSR